MNDELEKLYIEEEVTNALFQMAPSKAPGVDAFTAGFFQRQWHFLKDDIVSAVLDSLNGGELPEGMNDTSITSIPKVQFPQKYLNTILSLCVWFCIKLLPRLLLTVHDSVWTRLLVMNRVPLFLAA